MVKFTVEQKLQSLNLLKEGNSTCSLAQIIGAESHQTIDTWVRNISTFEVQEAIEKWIEYYNQTRIRHKLKGRTPIEYRNTALANIK